MRIIVQGRLEEYSSWHRFLDGAYWHYRQTLSARQWIVKETDDAIQVLCDGVAEDIKQIANKLTK